MESSDDSTARFQFQRLSLVRGYGNGSSGRGFASFTYAPGANVSKPDMTLPAGKALGLRGNDLVFVDARQTISAILPLTDPIAPELKAAPDVMPSDPDCSGRCEPR